MTEDLDHLASDIRDLAMLSAEERCVRMYGRGFTDTPQARRVLESLGDRRDHARHLVQPHLLVWGFSGMGKTTIIERYMRYNEPMFDKAAGVRVTPVVQFGGGSAAPALPNPLRMVAGTVLASLPAQADMAAPASGTR
jgi:hypothetical protein